MRTDLRKLYWRLRAELIRRSVLEEAVEEACSQLISERFRQESLQEVSCFVQPFLARFEEQIRDARLWLHTGDHRRSVLLVEGAERALARAREAACADEEWRTVRDSWTDLSSSWGLSAFPKLATVRVPERSLEVAESFLAAGEARKARLVTKQLRLGLGGLTRREVNETRRASLVRGLVAFRRDGGREVDALATTAGRLVDAGLLELAQRLIEDWRAGESLPALPPSAARFDQIEREAGELLASLNECHRGKAMNMESE